MHTTHKQEKATSNEFAIQSSLIMFLNHHIPPHSKNEGFPAGIATKPFADQRAGRPHNTCAPKISQYIITPCSNLLN